MNNNNLPLGLGLLIVGLVAAGCASTAPTAGSAPTFGQASSLTELLLERPDLSNGLWGIRILRLDTGAELYTRNKNTSFVPASNTKLYTTAAAIDQFGADHRFVTKIVTDGQIVDHTLDGNLIVIGSGDPSISGRFHDGDPVAIFNDWARQLLELGIQRISGNVVGDDNLFDEIPLGYGWSWDDEPYYYSAEIGALTFNDNCVDLEITAQRPGQPASISWSPNNTNYVVVENRTVTVNDEEEAENRYSRDRASNRIVVSSTIETGDKVRESISIHNPTAFFVSILRDVLVENGIEIDGYAIDIDDWDSAGNDSQAYEAKMELVRHESPTVAELSAVLNKRSHNLYAEQFLRLLGSNGRYGSKDSTSAELGLEAAARTWAAAGVDTSRIQLVDGSGLSRYNFVTANMTSQLLGYMWRHQDSSIRDAFLGSLSVGGVDGTIRNRFKNDGMTGRVRAKTGTVSNVSSLSGYVTTDEGVPLAFAIMANNFTADTDTVRAVQDAIVTAFARSRTK